MPPIATDCHLNLVTTNTRAQLNQFLTPLIATDCHRLPLIAISISSPPSQSRAQLNQFLTGQWVSFNLDIISTLVTVATLLIPVILFHTGASVTASPAAFGLAISYALELSLFLKHCTKMTLDLAAAFSSIERIFEYVNCT